MALANLMTDSAVSLNLFKLIVNYKDAALPPPIPQQGRLSKIKFELLDINLHFISEIT